MNWTIYYSDGEVSGTSKEQWDAAPLEDVQIVLVRNPHPNNHNPWRGFKNLQLWTGDDEYSINGWSIKYGALMDYDTYILKWNSLKNHIAKEGNSYA